MAVIWEEPYESLTDLRERAKAEIAKVQQLAGAATSKKVKS